MTTDAYGVENPMVDYEHPESEPCAHDDWEAETDSDRHSLTYGQPFFRCRDCGMKDEGVPCDACGAMGVLLTARLEDDGSYTCAECAGAAS